MDKYYYRAFWIRYLMPNMRTMESFKYKVTLIDNTTTHFNNRSASRTLHFVTMYIFSTRCHTFLNVDRIVWTCRIMNIFLQRFMTSQINSLQVYSVEGGQLR